MFTHQAPPPVSSSAEPLDDMVGSNSQTRFAAEEPFFESPQFLPSTEPSRPKKPFWSRRRNVVAVAVGVSLVVLSGLLIVNEWITAGRRLRPGQAPELVPVPTTPALPLLVRQQQLQLQWREADPSVNNLLFPPVDPELRLEAVRR